MTPDDLSDLARRGAQWEIAARAEMRQAAGAERDVWAALVRAIVGARRMADRAMVALAERRHRDAIEVRKVS